MKQVPLKDFFISYNNADRHWAEWIAWELENAGFSVIIQAWDFRPGFNFVLEMQKAAEKTKRTIAILSPDYLEALYTQPEWAASFVQDPTGQNGAFLPVRVRKCELTGLLKAIIYIDIVGINEQAAREALLTGINVNRIKPNTAPTFPGATAKATVHPRFPGSIPSILEPAKRNPRPASEDTKVLEIFFCFAPENTKMRDTLEKHLKILQQQFLQSKRLRLVLNNGEISAGKVWQQEIEKHLVTANIILLLVSPDFLTSEFCRNIEMKVALTRHKEGKATVIPIILRPCPWKDEKFGQLRALPMGEKPINRWLNRDEAFLNVTDGIRKVIESSL